MQPFLSDLLTPQLAGQLLTLLVLILLQLALAVALAVREREFEWQYLADFYRALVLPYVIGWLAFMGAARFIVADLLGPYSVIVGDGVTWLAWLAVVASLGARIVETVRSLYGSMMPFPDPDRE
jgi:hypothetical protein